MAESAPPRRRPTSAAMRVVWVIVAFLGGGLVGLFLVLPRTRWLRPRRVLACDLCQRRHRRLLVAMVVLALLSVSGFGLRVSQRARQLPACVADTSIAEGRRVIDPRAPKRPPLWSTVRSVMTAPVSGLALAFAQAPGRGLCSVGDPPITLAFVPQAAGHMGSMVGEVFMASPVPRINPIRARDLAQHESRHVDQWAVCSIVGGIALLPVLYLVDNTLYPGSENHFEQAAGLFDGAYPPPPNPPKGPQGWAIALWVGVLLVITRRRIRWTVRTVLSPDRAPDIGRCGVHTTGWR
ncbi:MFS family permease [Phycicoccus badiiscoriae]|uniref:MFS family permease n=1 Tax=Pedococcus badiiscoriae TaxID=642776 RepID=A0A852WHU7_9MICO|nr:hypothetical protein [Pedococcus badiiscoriae]NYG08349.1 MFS family permease [Pedococcus badiiscoriae]